MYNQKKTQPEIADIYKCSVSTISSILKSMDVETRSGGSMHDEIEISQWETEYNNGSTLEDIAKKYNSAYCTVSKLLKQRGVNIDRYTYHFNEHYFDIIDTQEKAYILGLLWADGYNQVDRGEIVLELQEKDKHILDNINTLTGNTRPLKFIPLNQKNSKWQNQYRLVWHSKYTSQVLDSYGMHQKKSLILEYPDCITSDLHPHFIRGYLDGDGCISLQSNGGSATISMVGTKMFLDRVSDILKNKLDTKVIVKRDLRAHDPICSLRCCPKADVKKILNWLYEDSHIHLIRKYEKYQKFEKCNKT